jgi:eukaryotic-like serine/threonine-protein kinase
VGESFLKRSLPDLDSVVGKYRIVRKLGEGGMGVVYEAVHTRIGQRVALKMLLPEVIDVPDVVSRFDREARAASRLKSENTARVLDVDVSDGGLPYMVMEFLDGSDLGRVLEDGGALPVVDAVDYVLQACNAMAEAHANGVIHRDLKPSNLFVTQSENGRRVKVLDFGISKVENDADGRVTATQTVVGTPLYMSPEQVRSAKHVDARTDIWSLGIILYELLAGRTPFEGSTTAAAVSICVDAPPPLATFRSDVPAELEQAILKALHKEPSGRYPNVKALAEAISSFGSGAIKTPASSLVSLPSAAASSGANPVVSLESARTLHDPSASGSQRVAGSATIPGWTTRSTTGPSRVRWAVIAGAVFVIAGTVVAFKVASSRSSAPSAPESARTLTQPSAPETQAATIGQAATQTASVVSTESIPSVVVSTSEPTKPHASARPHTTTAPPPATTATATATTKSTTAPAPTRL